MGVADTGRTGPSGSRTAADVDAALDAFRRIAQAVRSGARAGDPRGRPAGAQLLALRQIADHPGVSINDLAALTHTHQSSVSVVIQRLVAQRLVRKGTARHDRRLQQLELTGAGRQALRRTSAQGDRLTAAIAALPAKDLRSLRQLLATIIGRLSDDAAPPAATGIASRRRRTGARHGRSRRSTR
jgi:DNA-binding MarR family transcriptional regulator